MTVLTQTREHILSQPTHYEVLHPATGELLAYVALTPDKFASPLGRALEENGFRLVSLDLDASGHILAFNAP